MEWDKIVWTNLFKHYAYCLYRSYYLLRTEGDSIQLGSLPILGRWDELPTPEKNLFDDIWHRFLNVPNIQEIIEALANTERKIKNRELELYILSIHVVLSIQIWKRYFVPGMISDFEKHQLESDPEMHRLKSEIHGLKSVIRQLEESVQLEQLISWIELADTQPEKQINSIFLEREMIDNSEKIIQQYNNRTISTEVSERGHRLLGDDFPKVYLKKLERLLLPQWYTACFTKSYHNSSVWGNYGDKHKGACLIFESVEEDDKSNNLELNQMIGEKVRIPFYKTIPSPK